MVVLVMGLSDINTTLVKLFYSVLNSVVAIYWNNIISSQPQFKVKRIHLYFYNFEDTPVHKKQLLFVFNRKTRGGSYKCINYDFKKTFPTT